MQKTHKTFSYHWGSGYIAEEAQVEGPHNRPTFQLLKYTDGPAAGGVTVRFANYSPSGRFIRSPLLMSPEQVEDMQEALRGTPELRELLGRMVA